MLRVSTGRPCGPTTSVEPEERKHGKAASSEETGVQVVPEEEGLFRFAVYEVKRKKVGVWRKLLERFVHEQDADKYALARLQRQEPIESE